MFILLAILVVNCIAIKVDRKDCIDRFIGETSHQDILSSNGEENNKITLKSLKITLRGQNFWAGHILLPSASAGFKIKPSSYVRSSLIFMISDYCHHLFIIR